jgi:hypothetical protein
MFAIIQNMVQFTVPNTSYRTIAPVFTRPQMSARRHICGKARPARNAENLIAKHLKTP